MKDTPSKGAESTPLPSEPTPTPTTTADNTNSLAPLQPQAKLSKRRSARVLEHDPIIAPGFGTAKDLQQLAAQLELSVDAVYDLMTGRGTSRSSRSSKADEDLAAVSAAPVSSAWADFFGEAGMEDSAAATGAGTANHKRTYNLTTMSTTAKSPGSKKKAKRVTGILLQAGTLDSNTVGRTKVKLDQLYHCPLPSQISTKTRIAQVFTGSNACHSLALTETSALLGWGRNETHQLGSSMPKNVALPTLLTDVPDSSTVLSAATGKGHTILLLQNGSLYAMGANKVGQCGVKSTGDTVPVAKACVVASADDARFVQVSCGEDFSVALDENGIVYTTGSSEYGQLGNGETGEYFVSANKLAFANCSVFTPRTDHWYYVPSTTINANPHNHQLELVPDAGDIRIQAIACGKHHTIALEADGSDSPRLFSWGCGNYGCLGHNRQADEYYPRQLQLLPMTCDTRGSVHIAAGAMCNLIQTANGHVYYNGKHRSVGEATMKPILIEQLATNQHVITTCASGFQTVVCCTDIGNTVAWGQGPYGELGLQDKKSSSTPAFVEAMSGIPITQVACGYGHTLFVANDEDKAAKDAISKLPAVTAADVEPLVSE